MNTRRSLPKRKQHIEFTVSEEHIGEAVCGNTSRCAIALAMADKLNLAHGYIHVSAQALKFTKGDVRWRSFVSNRVLAWFYRFDQWGKGLAEQPEPIRFEASFEAYAWKAEPKDPSQIKAKREEHQAKLRAKGETPKVYPKKERLVGINLPV